ncbi:MAG: molybdopterin-dependent oxidoreductase [Pseudomonadota bacterium]
MSADVKTTCPYCGVGCGVLARIDGDAVSIEGDTSHPANFGKLCSKGAALADVLSLEGRLLAPHVGGEKVSWDTALDTAAARIKDALETHGPESVAFYVSGQLLTEDYYVANKLMKGFIGTANIDTNSRLCMASSVAGHKRAFGEDAVPGTYEDLEQADLVVFTGSNFAWCHPVLFQRVLAAKEKRPGMQIIAIDPRQTATTEQADLHLALRPGSDVALFQGLLAWLNRQGAGDADYVDVHVEGMNAALEAAAPFTLDRVAAATGLEKRAIRQFYKAFAATQKTVTVYSQGVNQAADGTDRVNTILNCHLFTGRVGKPGCGPFSITGQPNAMGGREVGGLANQLASHLDIDNPDHRSAVQAFWRSPFIAQRAGLKAVDMFDAVAAGKIKAIWIMGTNPVDSLPNADAVRAALKACPTVIVSDVTADTDTAKCADILLPAAPWGEKDGTVTNSERRISRQRALRPLAGQAKPDWWALCEVARRLGFGDAFSFGSAADVFREYAQLTNQVVTKPTKLNFGPLEDISDAAYEALLPVQWPIGARGDGRLYGDGQYSTPSGKARAVVPAASKPAPREGYTLNTGRIRDQWHTMTRTGLSARLSQHLPEPFVDIHPEDALREGIGHASLVALSSPHGKAIVRARITARQQPGSIFAPMHWTGQYASAGRVDALVAANTDPFSGQPALKASMVSMKPFSAGCHGFIVCTRRPTLDAAYWAVATCKGGVRLECAGEPALKEAFTTWLETTFPEAETVHYEDQASGHSRLAVFDNDRLVAAGFFSPTLVDVARQWVVDQLSAGAQSRQAQHRLLAGRPKVSEGHDGATICSCMGVGIQAIKAAARTCRSVHAIGAATGAGTGCGSCQYEIKAILAEAEGKEDAIQAAI